jgi:hypothetical protein
MQCPVLLRLEHAALKNSLQSKLSASLGWKIPNPVSCTAHSSFQLDLLLICAETASIMLDSVPRCFFGGDPWRLAQFISIIQLEFFWSFAGTSSI